MNGGRRERARQHIMDGVVTAIYRADRGMVIKLLIAARIFQLKGEPDFNPEGLAMRSHAEYVAGDGLLDMIKQDLMAERIAIDSYGKMIQYMGDKDVTTRRMLEDIPAMEEEHAYDLSSMLEGLKTN